MTTIPRACHPGDGRKALNRLPQLAEPLLQFDLQKELQQLRHQDSWQRESGRSSKTLAKYPDFRIVLVLMKAGTQMNEHQAEGRVSIHHLLGRDSHTPARPEGQLVSGPIVGNGLRRAPRR